MITDSNTISQGIVEGNILDKKKFTLALLTNSPQVSRPQTSDSSSFLMSKSITHPLLLDISVIKIKKRRIFHNSYLSASASITYSRQFQHSVTHTDGSVLLCTICRTYLNVFLTFFLSFISSFFSIFIRSDLSIRILPVHHQTATQTSCWLLMSVLMGKFSEDSVCPRNIRTIDRQTPLEKVGISTVEYKQSVRGDRQQEIAQRYVTLQLSTLHFTDQVSQYKQHDFRNSIPPHTLTIKHVNTQIHTQ